MRKILLGTTAVVSAAFGAAVVTPAAAQEAPTVRLGGSIQATTTPPVSRTTRAPTR
jgi:ABC-type sugar transport system substrate-binding protein